MMTRYLLLLFVQIFAFGFSQKIEGNYYPLEAKCNIKLNINSKNHFLFIVNNNEKSGIVKISKENDVTYLDFDNISSMYDADTISMQNSGNSINQYWCFKNCDEKYIHLVKEKTEKSIKVNNCRNYVKNK